MKNRSRRSQHSDAEPGHNMPSGRTPQALSKSNRFRHITAQRIADENHISWATVSKYASYSNALELIRSKAPEIPPLILSGDYRIAHDSVILLSRMDAVEIRNTFREVVAGNRRAVSYPSLRSKATSGLPDAKQDSVLKEQ